MKMKTKDLVLMAMYIAIFVVLEFLSDRFGLFKMQAGGKLSLSIIPLIIAGYQFGFGRTLFMSMIALVLKFMFNPPTFVHVVQFIMDYIVAYGSYSIVGLFKDWNVKGLALPIGVIIANIVRFMAHNISGWVFFAEYYPVDMVKAVMVYNLTYMIPTTIVSFIVVMVIKPRLLEH
ncbi:energy-coupled thiamine transporter ThiT [Erysipelothrix urinaevulpis]|uniref:energy-coupled thiamine transporter ThiT n=1 Tax=Erysipelothrix urinaevulpis TaxID=2683717 RepID=UPI0013569427|nr:energy-coupled thiamine transporter ThiT [Erysipelothrix urinaevulpis]